MNQRVLVAFLLAFAALLGCRRDNQIVVPNRVLDRPLDVVLTCFARNENGGIEARSLDACDSPTVRSCSTTGVPQLLAFIANSERNEVAIARRCDTTAAVVDMDADTPGYQLIPVGQLPSHITATELGCRVVTSNEGSCDLSVLDAAGLATYALETTVPTAPSALVSRLVPLRSDGVPLAARPGVVLSVPDELSLAGRPANDPAPGDGAETGDDAETGDGAETGEGAGTTFADEGQFSLCPPDKFESVWVTFPACHLVAELSVNTGQILQSRRFVLAPDGTVTVEDGGTTPDCPVECAIQFDGGVPSTCGSDMDGGTETGGDTDSEGGAGGQAEDCRPPVDEAGYYPIALEPVVSFDPNLSAGSTYPSLFVGGRGSDTIVEIQFEGNPGDESGRWADPATAPTLTLDRAQGVHAIRATPLLPESGRQFLYAIAGDGSTHVVERFFERDNLGQECDTQIDPTVPLPDPLCSPIDPDQLGRAPDRRPFAVGPGIRASLGAAITDWAFFSVTAEDLMEDPEDALERDPWTPFATPGVVGVGVTSFGRVVLSVFDQLIGQPVNHGTMDPVGVMNLTLNPHRLWPSINPHSLRRGDDPIALPIVDDEEPDRTLPGPDDSSQVLAPSLRRIDLAYAVAPDDQTLSPDRQALAESLGSPTNEDQLGAFSGEAIYETEAPRVAVRDYERWAPQRWSLLWEGSIPGTRSNTGRIVCDAPSTENSAGTCRPPDGAGPEVSRLVDEAASFCDQGVLPGDKLVLLGCNGDDDCGLGQKCLREPTAPSSTNGICISATAYEEQFQVLRQVCAPFITDPCGSPRLEYVITDAFQNELWLRPMDIPASAHLVDSPRRPGDDETVVVGETEERFTCALPYTVNAETIPGATAGGLCTSDADCRGGAVPARCVITTEEYDRAERATDDDADGNGISDDVPLGTCRAIVGACDTDADCVPSCPPGDAACQENADKHLCINRVCRGPCDGGDPECTDCEEDNDCVHYGPDAICSDNRCKRPCESGSPDCTLARLPGPACFPELVQYLVRVRNSFLVQGDPSFPFITDRVIADPTTGRCREDPSVSTLLTSRIRLGADEDETFGGVGYPYVIPSCPNASEASPSDPNPCRITNPRASGSNTLFHTFAYEEQDVAAIRFSNPFMSIVLDMTDLRALASEVPNYPQQRFDPSFARFRRGRIPRGYSESFAAIPGYVPYSETVVVGTTVMVYPVRIVRGPESSSAFIVDAGGRGGPAGVRGQLIRIIAEVISQGGIEDQDFLVR